MVGRIVGQGKRGRGEEGSQQIRDDDGDGKEDGREGKRGREVVVCLTMTTQSGSWRMVSSRWRA